MLLMFIVPISELQPITPIAERTGLGKAVSADSPSFDNVLKKAFDNLEEAQTVSEKNSIDLALGKSDDLHSIEIASMKATAAIELTTGVTSKVISAYKEIINMQL